MKRTISLAAILACYTAASAGAETHRFAPVAFYNTFSFAHQPALRIKPGDRVITVTIDAGGIDANDQRVGTGPNPQTGPFYVEGAGPGDCAFGKVRPAVLRGGRSTVAHYCRRSRA